MPKKLIVLAVVVAVVAVVAVAVAVVLTKGREEQPGAAPGPLSQNGAAKGLQDGSGTVSPDANSESVASEGTRVKPPVESASQGTVTVKAPAGEGKTPRTVTMPPVTEVRVTRGTVSSDDPEAVRAERIRQIQEDAKYRLPSEYRLKALDYAHGDELKLTDDQKEQVRLITDRMRERSKAELEDTISELEQLQARMQELYRTRGQVQQGLDGEFMEQLRTILTPEQLEVVEGRSKVIEKVPLVPPKSGQ